MAINKTIMLVEDDPTMQSVLATLLEFEGYKVVIGPVGTKESILRSIRDHSPDILFMDVSLRSVSGIDVLKGLRRDPDLNHLRVLMSSGMDLKGTCLAAGANDFLLKPFMPDELLEKLNGKATL
jgi:CheY-like chemotaxis protein